VPGQTTTVTTTTTIPVVFMPLYTYPHSDPATDASKLRKSMKGLGTDDSALISIMTNRSKAQLQLIQEAYLREFKHSLEKDIRGDTSGNYCTLLCDLLRPVLAYKVETVKKAVKGLGTREKNSY
jgi:annexin A7/11